MMFEGLVGLAICGGIGLGVYQLFHFTRSITGLFQQIAPGHNGRVERKWKFMPVLRFPLDTAGAEFFLVPGKKRVLWLVVTAAELENFIGLWITEGKVLRGVVPIGRREFDARFTVSTSANVTKNEALVRRKLTPELQQALLNAKATICAEIANQFLELFHPEKYPRMMLKVNNFAVHSSFGKLRTEASDIERFEAALNSLVNVYQVFRKTAA